MIVLDVLPDSRLQTSKGVTRGPGGNWVPIFCAMCGSPGGLVPEENVTFAFYLCNPCAETHGQIAGTMMIPDEVFWQDVAAEQVGKKQSTPEGG